MRTNSPLSLFQGVGFAPRVAGFFGDLRVIHNAPTHGLPKMLLWFHGRGKPDVSGTLTDVHHEFVIGDGEFQPVGSVE